MFEFLSNVGFMPHSHCYLRKPSMMALHGFSDVLIGAAYVSISLILYLMVRRIRLPFSPIILAFGIFIAACGLTHFMEVWNLYHASYWEAGIIKAVTALASVATAALLIPTRPRVVELATAAGVSEARRVALEAKTVELETLNAQIQALAHENLHVSEQRFRSLVEAVAQVVWLRSPEGHVVEDSPTWRIFTGQSLAEYRGRGWLDAVHPEDRPALEKAWAAAVRNRPSLFEYEYRLRRPNGQYAYVQSRATPILTPAGAVREWVGALTDITPRKQAELAQARLLEQTSLAVKTRDDFLSVAAHELRTPLTSMKLQLEMLQRAVTPLGNAAVGARVGAVGRQLLRLQRLNEQLLDVSQLEREPELKREPLDLAPIVKSAVEQAIPLLERQGCGAVIDLKPAVAVVDGARLEQVLTNLLDNAAKYGAGKPVHVTLARSGDQVLLSVRDEGIGVEPDAVARIFGKFERAVSVEHYGGLGLGLFIAHRLVTAMNGTLSVKSEPGKGAEFTIALPAST